MGDTIVAHCDLSDTLHGLPAAPLRELLLRVSGREIFDGYSSTSMLKVFVAEHLCDDVEESFGPFTDKELAVTEGKDFVMTLSFDRELGRGSLEVLKIIESRLPHWNRHFEVLLRSYARQEGFDELVEALDRP